MANSDQKAGPPILRVEDVHKSFAAEGMKNGGRVDVLRGVGFTLNAGDKAALTGESGCGKSTLLYLAAGLESVDKGRIVLDGHDLATLDDKGKAALRRTTVGLVFQQFNLVPSLTVFDNLRFHAPLAGRHDEAWTGQLLHRLGLGDLLQRYPEQLSGGQQQRVAIGRTLAAKPKLVLADEPTGNLDQDTGDAVIDLMLELVDETGATLLMVTHSRRLAGRMGRIYHMERGRLACGS